MAARFGKPGVLSGSTGSQIGVSVAAGETNVQRTPLPVSSSRNT
jgi:hypothetical protein